MAEMTPEERTQALVKKWETRAKQIRKKLWRGHRDQRQGHIQTYEVCAKELRDAFNV